MTSDFETALLNNIPWGRLGTPADVAPAALFLASPAADYVTGEVLAVNGGPLPGACTSRSAHRRRADRRQFPSRAPATVND